jgi:Uma2 family endonuclease
MASLAAETNCISVEDYLTGEKDGEVRHEYVAGHVYAMTGASARHGLIAGALHALLHQRARQKGCQLFISDMKVRIRQAGEEAFYYPDLLLACEPDDRADYYREKPCLLIEVLSDTTERIDRREQLYAYTSGLPSLRDYLVVAQDRRQVDIYRRTETDWMHETVTEGALRLGCLDMDLVLDSIYEDIEQG